MFQGVGSGALRHVCFPFIGIDPFIRPDSKCTKGSTMGEGAVPPSCRTAAVVVGGGGGGGGGCGGGGGGGSGESASGGCAT